MAIHVVLHVSKGALCSYSKLEKNLWVLREKEPIRGFSEEQSGSVYHLNFLHTSPRTWVFQAGLTTVWYHEIVILSRGVLITQGIVK